MREDTVVQLRHPGSFEDDPLTEVLRLGARRLLGQAVEAEVAGFVEAYAHLTDSAGRRRIVRHGHLPERDIQTGIGPVAVRCPRVRDRGAGATGPRVRFTSRILPPYLRRAKSIEELLPWLYLKGISTGDFCEALAALLGPEAPGLSASTIARLKEVWQGELEHWQRRDLSAKRHVCFWANGVYFSPRLDHDKQCMCVIIGADELGRKEAAGDRRRLPGERPVLARSAARSQAPRPGDCARAGHRRRGARFLESLARGLRDDARAALLGAQDRQRAQQAPEVRPATRQAAPTGHLDGRDPRGGREGLRLLPRGLWPQVRQSGGLPGQGPRRVARLLRLPGRAPEAHSHHQSHRKHLCDRAPQDHQDQGLPQAA